MSTWMESPVMVQFFITAATLGSAWMTNRVWRGRKEAKADAAAKEAADATEAPVTPVSPAAVAAQPVARFDDPSTPVGMVITRLDAEIRALRAELDRANEREHRNAETRARDAGRISRLEAENTALREDKEELAQRVRRLEAHASVNGR